MPAAKAVVRSDKTQFPPQVRFNWGFWEGYHAMRSGKPNPWWGPKGVGFQTFDDNIWFLQNKHCDRIAAAGALAGFRWVRQGRPETENSTQAWREYQKASATERMRGY